jgi:hypothetical protein
LYDNETEDGGVQTLALFEWQGSIHVGRLRYLFPEKPYIVVVSKVADPITPQVANALRKQRPVPTFKVHPRLEFAGPRYLLGVSGRTLCSLSGEDVLYCLLHSRNHPVRNFSTGTDLIGFDAA